MRIQDRASFRCLDGMRGGVDVDTGRDLNLIADRDPIAVEENAVVVDEGPVADGDVEPIVATERGLQYRVLAKPLEQVRQQGATFFASLRRSCVESC